MHRETKGLHGDTWDGNAAQTTKNASGFPRGPPGVPRAGANCDGFGVPTALLRTRHGVLCQLPRPQYLVIGTVASHHIWVVRRGQRTDPRDPDTESAMATRNHRRVPRSGRSRLPMVKVSVRIDAAHAAAGQGKGERR